MKGLELMVSLWPTFPHFSRFAQDYRLAGIRLNTAMVKAEAMGDELVKAQQIPDHVPLYFDIKGRQLRVMEVAPNTDNLELTLNHPIEVQTPTPVLFKAGEDHALLERVEGGNHLVFRGGPQYMVYAGESLHIRHPSLNVLGPTFLDYEIEKIAKARQAGFDKFYLSYVGSQREIDEFRQYVGDAQIMAKIEDKKGLEYVAREYKPQKNLNLVAARGDLYVEVDKPHDILEAMRLIIDKDKDAIAGSRMLLSVMHSPVPSCADLSELAWLHDIGYRRLLLCDEICLKGELLGRAVNVVESLSNTYAADRAEIITAQETPGGIPPLRQWLQKQALYRRIRGN